LVNIVDHLGKPKLADCLVPGDLSHPPGQDSFGCAGPEAVPGISYPTAWLIQHKLMEAMSECETHYTLSGLFLLFKSVVTIQPI
jgi:hypothetical protein